MIVLIWLFIFIYIVVLVRNQVLFKNEMRRLKDNYPWRCRKELTDHMASLGITANSPKQVVAIIQWDDNGRLCPAYLFYSGNNNFFIHMQSPQGRLPDLGQMLYPWDGIKIPQDIKKHIHGWVRW